MLKSVVTVSVNTVMCTEFQKVSHHRDNPVHRGTEEKQNGLKNYAKSVTMPVAK